MIEASAELDTSTAPMVLASVVDAVIATAAEDDTLIMFAPKDPFVSNVITLAEAARMECTVRGDVHAGLLYRNLPALCRLRLSMVPPQAPST